MRFLGVDFGIKRVGIAISDEEGQIAFPKETLKNDSSFFQNFLKILEKEKIDLVVLGDSLDLSGKENKISKEIEKFIFSLKEKGIKVDKQKEFFSSYEAHGRLGKESKNTRGFFQKKTNDLDASSATIILQRYLDKINNLNKKND